MTCKVVIKDGRLYVDEFETTNQEVVSYFTDMREEKRVEKFESVVLAGTVAFRTIGTTEKIDYIKRAFDEFHRCFDDKIEDTFGENGKIITELFDPNKDGTPLCCLKDEILKVMDDIKLKIEGKKIAKELEELTTYKGYTFEEFCENVLSNMISKQTDGDQLLNTTKEPGLLAGSKKGDFVISLGKTGLKIAIETKHVAGLTVPKIHSILDESMENRDAKYGIFVVKNVEALPKSVGFFKEYYGNQLVVALGTKESEDLLAKELLFVAYNWAKTKLLVSEGIEGREDITPLLQDKLPRIEDSLKKFSKIRTQCTSIKNTTDKILRTADEIEEEVKSQLQDIRIEIERITSS